MERQMRHTFWTGLGKALLALAMALGVCAPAHAEGGDLIWARSVEGERLDDNVYGVATDAQGNCYILGWFRGTVDFDPGPESAFLTADNNNSDDASMFLLKLNAAGRYLWAEKWDTGQYMYSHLHPSLALDAGGNVYVGGVFDGTVDFDTGPGTATLTATEWGSGFVLKLDSSGSLQWAKSLGGNIHGENSYMAYWGRDCIAVDSGGNVFFAGFFFQQADFDPGIGTAILTPTGHSGAFLVKLDAFGNYLWGKSLMPNPYGNFEKLQLATDREGHVLVASCFTGTFDFDPGPGTAILSTVPLSTGCFLAEFDSLGNLLWVKGYSPEGIPPLLEVHPRDICVDSDNNIYLVGTFAGSVDFDPGPGDLTLASWNGTTGVRRSVFVLKLNALGDLIRARSVNGPDVDVSGIAVDASGSIFIAGTGYGQDALAGGLVNGVYPQQAFPYVYLDDSPILCMSRVLPYVLKLDRSCNLVWAEYMNGGGLDTLYAHDSGIAVGGDGNVIMADSIYGTVDFDPGPGTAIIGTPNSRTTTAIAKLDGSDRATPFQPTGVIPYASHYNPATGIEMSLFFTAPVTEFDASDLQVTNARVTRFVGAGCYYNFHLLPTAAGLVTISMNIPAGAARDVHGVDTLASTPFSETYDVPVTDNDGDGLPDHIEALIGTDLFNTDTDGDRLSDGVEVGWDGDPEVYTPGVDTNPLSPDTDGDGISDGMEAVTGHDPLDLADIPSLPLTALGSLLTMVLIGAAYAHRRTRARGA